MSTPLTARIRNSLAGASPEVFAVYAIVMAFSTYFCMYAYRKPFAAGIFAGDVEIPLLGTLSYKSLFIISQVGGYCLSKFAGIKIISEMPANRRARAILVFIAVAWVALLGFALVPSPYRAIFLFVNGLPLGMIWGLVFGFLEGRRISEVLGAGLSASYILASGAVKAVGLTLVGYGVPETWMPFVVGALFSLPMLVFVLGLSLLPPPNAADRAHRTERLPMDRAARRTFVRRFFPGLLLLTLAYICLTTFRDFRDNFAVELWRDLGYTKTPSILAQSEIPVTIGALLALALVMLVRNNRRAVGVVHAVMLFGVVLIGASTLLYHIGWISPATWMVLIGLGLYVAYVPFGCILFDRLIAALGDWC